MYILYMDLKMLTTPPAPPRASTARLLFAYRLKCYWFPVGAGDFSLFTLIQQFCLLNSNLGLKHFPIKPKLEDRPAGTKARSIEGPRGTRTGGFTCTEKQIPWSGNLAGPGGMGQKWVSLFKTEYFLPKPTRLLTECHLPGTDRWGRRPGLCLRFWK